MPPRKYSRHLFCLGIKDADANDSEDALQLTEREPFPYRDLSDTAQHLVREGETLHTIAGRYYSDIPGGARLWWVIADFQPDPIHDPTLKLDTGRTLFIPSVRTVLELIFSETRRMEPGL